MARTNGTFKLSKTSKLQMATLATRSERNAFKKAMIGAEAAAAVKPISRDRSKDVIAKV